MHVDSLVFNTTVPDGVSGEWLLKIIDLGLAFPYYSHFSRGHGRFWKPLMGVFSLRLVYVDGLAFVEGVRGEKHRRNSSAFLLLSLEMDTNDDTP